MMWSRNDWIKGSPSGSRVFPTAAESSFIISVPQSHDRCPAEIAAAHCAAVCVNVTWDCPDRLSYNTHSVSLRLRQEATSCKTKLSDLMSENLILPAAHTHWDTQMLAETSILSFAAVSGAQNCEDARRHRSALPLCCRPEGSSKHRDTGQSNSNTKRRLQSEHTLICSVVELNMQRSQAKLWWSNRLITVSGHFLVSGCLTWS